MVYINKKDHGLSIVLVFIADQFQQHRTARKYEVVAQSSVTKFSQKTSLNYQV